uniref:TVA4 protein n=1 Tax=Anas zonorhyncha TaxID=75864 RepID=A0A8B9UAR0_9AVES
PWAETTEGTGINITCSHPNIQTVEVIYWYRHLPGQGPASLAFGTRGSNALRDLPGWLVVAADRRSSALWLTDPRLRDAAVYYSLLGDWRGIPDCMSCV